MINHNKLVEFCEKNPLKKWIKLIPLSECLPFEKCVNKDFFTKVADVELDEEINESTGTKKRMTLIKFVPTISLKKFECDDEWLYIFTVNKRVVKIGGTRTGLKKRTASYLCGHHIRERGKSGDCSKTNGFIYNTFEFYLRNGYEIEMFGYKLPVVIVKTLLFDEMISIDPQKFHTCECIFLEKFKKQTGKYPFLSDNCDPKHRKQLEEDS